MSVERRLEKLEAAAGRTAGDGERCPGCGNAIEWGSLYPPGPDLETFQALPLSERIRVCLEHVRARPRCPRCGFDLTDEVRRSVAEEARKLEHLSDAELHRLHRELIGEAP